MNNLSNYSIYYLGYFKYDDIEGDIILCVSNDVNQVKYYLTEIRNLVDTQYEIREVPMDLDMLESFYGDLILEPYMDSIAKYITRQDIENLNAEIDFHLSWIDRMLSDLESYERMVSHIDKFAGSLSSIYMCRREILTHMSSTKNIRKLAKAIIRNSPVLSPKIGENFYYSKTMHEDRELTIMYHKHVQEDT